jgi:hypothetical protein
MPLTIYLYPAPSLSVDDRQRIVEQLRHAGYTVLDPCRHLAVGEPTPEELQALAVLDEKHSDLSFIIGDTGEVMVFSTAGHAWVKNFATADDAVTYLTDRSRDDDPSMVPELF